MIVLYRKEFSPEGDSIEEKLRDLVAAHRVVTVDRSAGEDPEVPERLPAVRDGGELISGDSRIREYLNRLEKRMETWNRFQSDACYMGDDGDVC